MAKLITLRTLYFTSANGKTVSKVDADLVDDILPRRDSDKVQGKTVIINKDGGKRSSSESVEALHRAMGW